MAANKFSGKADETLTIVAPGGVDLNHILLIGLGKPDQIKDITVQDAGGAIVAALGKNAAEVSVWSTTCPAALWRPSQVAAEIAFGALLRSYRFDKYRTKEKPEAKPALQSISRPDRRCSRRRRNLRQQREALAGGIFLTRDVVSEPANIIYPRTFAERCRELTEVGVEVQVLDQEQMAKLGMGAILGVAQGSVQEPYLVVMKYDGDPGASDKRPVAFVGKGVTFDTGGISIKPAAGMEDMKWDMGGAGVVLGLMKALAARKAKVNAVGVVGLVENMPSGNAQRPGDIVTSMSGQTIEVLNTDAEGRLVLADALWFTQDTFKPRAMIDLATLTGAIIVALGTEHAGLFSNNDELSEQLTAAGLQGRREAVAAADERRLRQGDQLRRRRRQEHRRQPRRRQHHRRPVPPALRQQRALGSPGHRRRDLGQEGQRHGAEGQHRLRRPPARPLRRRRVRGLTEA